LHGKRNCSREGGEINHAEIQAAEVEAIDLLLFIPNRIGRARSGWSQGCHQRESIH
jgi:hypothetical protein